MINLEQYDDDVVLTTKELAEWLQCSAKTVSRLGLKPTPHRHRQRCFLAGEVKRRFRGERKNAVMPLRRVG